MAQCAANHGDPHRSRWPKRIVPIPDDALRCVEKEALPVWDGRLREIAVLMGFRDT